MSVRGVIAFFIATVVLLCAGGVGYTVAANAHETTHTSCVVESKDRTTRADSGSSDMRVYTSCGTFAVGDVLLRGQFDSADIYGSISEGQTYDLTTIGWRVPILSMFPTIIEAEDDERAKGEQR